MKHPSSAKCFKLSKIFLDLAKKYPKAEVRMGSIDWPRKKDKASVCGTPACHAGWYGFTLGLKCNETDFNDSAEKMAEFLGFTRRPKEMLEYWATKYKRIWGNIFGGSMFYEAKAFERASEEEITLKDIGNHWKAVAQRLRKLEQSK